MSIAVRAFSRLSGEVRQWVTSRLCARSRSAVLLLATGVAVVCVAPQLGVTAVEPFEDAARPARALEVLPYGSPRERLLQQGACRACYLRGLDLQAAHLIGVDLREADLRGANLRGANLEGADLSDARLQGASLVGATLTNATMVETDLRHADLSNAVVIHAYAPGVQVEGMRIAGADLTGSHLIVGGDALEGPPPLPPLP